MHKEICTIVEAEKRKEPK